ncbi:MAG: alanine racemase [Corynebacteriales bacterium]|nr:alanine racemase [Mycobacteriales bacterium]
MVQAEAVIDLDAIRDNTAVLAGQTSAAVMAVVKADGYGHGMVPAARAALAGGATYLGACTVSEALALRAAGIDAPMLAWLFSPSVDLAPAVLAKIDLSAASVDDLRRIEAAVDATGVTARVHLKVDTGLGRNGSPAQLWPELLQLAAKAQASNAIEIVGVWSHFACADEPGHPSIVAQLDAFEDALNLAAQLGVRPLLRHLANSAATLTVPRSHFDMVRPGIALYGLSPMHGRESEFGLRGAMTLRAEVALTKRVGAGHGVSYGLTYTTDRETTLALIPLGYGDGIPRALSSKAPIFVNGAWHTIAGRVCMDQVVIDVGDEKVLPGDVAILFGPGDAGEPHVNDWAEAMDTINYEIVTRISARVPRRYVGGAAQPVI